VKLHEETKDTIQKGAELLVSSALKRPLQTTVIGYPDLRQRLEGEGKRVIILPQLQEVSIIAGSIEGSYRFPQTDAFPCNIGSVRSSRPH